MPCGTITSGIGIGCKSGQNMAKKILEDWGMSNVKLERWGTFGKNWENKHMYVAMSAPYYEQNLECNEPYVSFSIFSVI